MADHDKEAEPAAKKKSRQNKYSHQQRDRKRKQAAIDKRAAKAFSSNNVTDNAPAQSSGLIHFTAAIARNATLSIDLRCLTARTDFAAQGLPPVTRVPPASSGYAASAAKTSTSSVSGVENKSSANVSKKRKTSSPPCETETTSKRLKANGSGRGSWSGMCLRIKAAGDELLNFGSGLFSRIYGLYNSLGKPSTSQSAKIGINAVAPPITTTDEAHATAVVAVAPRVDSPSAAPAFLPPRARLTPSTKARSYDNMEISHMPRSFRHEAIFPAILPVEESNRRLLSFVAFRDRQESFKLRKLNMRNIRSVRLGSSSVSNASVSSASDSIVDSETDGGMFSDSAECTGVKYIEANIEKDSPTRTRSLYGRGCRRFESGSFSLGSNDTSIGELRFSSASTDVIMGGTSDPLTESTTEDGRSEATGLPTDQQPLSLLGQSQPPALSSDGGDVSMGGTSDTSTDTKPELDRSEVGGLPAGQQPTSLFGQNPSPAPSFNPMTAPAQQPLPTFATSQPQTQPRATASQPRAPAAQSKAPADQSRGGVKKKPSKPPTKRTGVTTGKKK